MTDRDTILRLYRTREWEAAQRIRDRENLLKWILLVMGVVILITLTLIATTPARGATAKRYAVAQALGPGKGES